MIDYNHKLHDEFIQNILNTRGRFGIHEGEYKERHHIIPECKGGQTIKENLIDLYAQEHYDAHKLLFEENPNDYQLACAWHNFHTRKASPNAPEIEVDREEYARLKTELSRLRSEAYSGEGNPRYGNHIDYRTEASMEKFRQSMANRSDEEKELSHKKLLTSMNAKSEAELAEINYKKGSGSRGKKRPPRSAEWCENISKSKKGKPNIVWKEKQYNPRSWGAGRKKGYKESDEAKKKKSIAMTGAKNSRAKAVRCLETNEIFDCIKYACEAYSLNKNQIIDCCKGRKETAGGYHWEYVNK